MQNNPIEFLKEAVIMHSIDNDHIVRLYGVVLDTDALMLVMINMLLKNFYKIKLKLSNIILGYRVSTIKISFGMFKRAVSSREFSSYVFM